MTEVKKFKAREFVGVRSLANAAGFESERTVRYYMAEGLLPGTLHKKGQAFIFGYLHLLVLLSIKKLQSHRIPLSAIKTIIAGKSDEYLEKLLDDEVFVFTNRSELEKFRRVTGHVDEGEVVVIDDATVLDEYLEGKGKKERHHESTLPAEPKSKFGRQKKSVVSRALPPANLHKDILNVETAGHLSGKWQRYQIVSGLELHVREGFEVPDNVETLMRSVERILRQNRSK